METEQRSRHWGYLGEHSDHTGRYLALTHPLRSRAIDLEAEIIQLYDDYGPWMAVRMRVADTEEAARQAGLEPVVLIKDGPTILIEALRSFLGFFIYLVIDWTPECPEPAEGPILEDLHESH